MVFELISDEKFVSKMMFISFNWIKYITPFYVPYLCTYLIELYIFSTPSRLLVLC